MTIIPFFFFLVCLFVSENTRHNFLSDSGRPTDGPFLLFSIIVMLGVFNLPHLVRSWVSLHRFQRFSDPSGVFLFNWYYARQLLAASVKLPYHLVRTWSDCVYDCYLGRAHPLWLQISLSGYSGRGIGQSCVKLAAISSPCGTY